MSDFANLEKGSGKKDLERKPLAIPVTYNRIKHFTTQYLKLTEIYGRIGKKESALPSFHPPAPIKTLKKTKINSQHLFHNIKMWPKAQVTNSKGNLKYCKIKVRRKMKDSFAF